MMACVVECYNPALAPSSAANRIAIPEFESLRGVAVPEMVFVSPRALHSLSQDLCSSEHSLHSSSSSTVDVATSPAPPAPPLASIATRAEPSSPRRPTEQPSQLGRPSVVLATHIHNSMRQREAALPPLQLASPQLHKRCVCSCMRLVILHGLQHKINVVIFSCRSYIVDFVQGACDILQLTRNTRFLAMLLVDHFMDKHIVMDYRLKLVALTSLLVSGELTTHCPPNIV